MQFVKYIIYQAAYILRSQLYYHLDNKIKTQHKICIFPCKQSKPAFNPEMFITYTMHNIHYHE